MDEEKKSKIKKLLARITELIEEVLDEKDTVEEVSTSGGPGGLSGGPRPLGGLGMPRKRSTRRRIVRPDPPKRKR
mgnify:FL=1